MKRLVLLHVLAALTAGSLVAQSYHDPRYIAGGRDSNLRPWEGIHLYDTGLATASRLLSPIRYDSLGHRMDWDNRHVVFTERGGLYRFDPRSPGSSLRTVSLLPAPYRLERFVVDQDGGYVVNAMRTIGMILHHDLLRIDRNGAVRTMFTTLFNHPMLTFEDTLCRNIDTGHYLVTDCNHVFYGPVYEVTDQGQRTAWNTGPNQGWNWHHSMPQNHRNGFLEAPLNGEVYQLQPGGGGSTILTTLAQGAVISYGTSGFDLQTAARPRWVATGTTLNMDRVVLYTIDHATFSVTSISIKNNPYNANWVMHFDFDFYRGRHLQTIKSGKFRWDIRMSCPRFPGKTYALVAGLSGVRPGVALPDGRCINLKLDDLVLLTLQNQVPALFHPGPCVLDSSGEATGRLDLSITGRLGIPIWLAMAVLDPGAPWGIAYLPDTYVMRI